MNKYFDNTGPGDRLALIGEIVSSKNVVLKAGSERLDGASYELLGESSREG